MSAAGVDGTRQRILDAAVEVINGGGEEAVRVADVARRAGVTQGMVTYHFGTRHALVLEAQLVRYSSTLSLDVATLHAAVDTIHDRDALLELGRRLTATLLSDERRKIRRARVNAVGFAAASDESWSALRSSATELLDAYTAFLEVMQRRGLLRAGVAPRAIATMMTSYGIGLFQFDLDERPARAEDLIDVIDGFLRSFLAET